MFYQSPHNVQAQKNWAHSPSSTRNLGTKSAISHFLELWNFTLKKLGSLSSLMKHMFCLSSHNVWAHPLPLLQLDIWAQSGISCTSENKLSLGSLILEKPHSSDKHNQPTTETNIFDSFFRCIFVKTTVSSQIRTQVSSFGQQFGEHTQNMCFRQKAFRQFIQCFLVLDGQFSEFTVHFLGLLTTGILTETTAPRRISHKHFSQQ